MQPYQPQSYAPQGYAPQQQYQQPIAYGQPPMATPQQQYYGQPAAPLPTSPQGGQGLPTQAPQLGQSGRAGGGATAPAPRHLVGRTVIFEPIKIDETTTQKDNNGNMVSRPTAHYHLTVVDGGPLQYGDNRDHDVSKQHGMTFEIDTPCRFTNVSSDRFGILNEIRDALARGDQASVGVVEQGTQGNRPFLVTKPGRSLDGKDRPDGDARFAAAMEVWTKIWNKDLSWNPTPRSLVAPPSQQPPQVAYAPTQAFAPAPQPAEGTYAYHNPVPPHLAGAGPALPQYNPQAYAAPAPAPVQQPAPPQDPAYAAYLAAQQAAAAPPVPQSVPPVDPQYAAWLAAQQQGQPAGPGI
jgi:hypothetical protein